MRKFFQADSSELMGVRLISVSWAQKRFIPTFRHHVRRVHEKYLLTDSNQLMRVRLISASWAQKRFIPTLQTSCTSNSWKIFFSPIRASWWVLDSFRPHEPKKVWFLLSGHDIRKVHEKLFSRRYERAVGCFTHFGLLSLKSFDSYFLDMM